jgi:hypothetical protein
VVRYFDETPPETAFAFADDLVSPLANCVRITNDGQRPHLEATKGAFGADVDCALGNS